LGLLPASRVRQVKQLQRYIARDVPAYMPVLVAGDFNDWGNTVKHMMAEFGFHAHTGAATPTYPSRLPLVQLDHVYARGVHPIKSFTPQGAIWARMSDHLPLLVEFAWDAP
jgi:endonuclease/exonuclease/phosphatase family metal-dependent hydrolase